MIYKCFDSSQALATLFIGGFKGRASKLLINIWLINYHRLLEVIGLLIIASSTQLSE